MGREARGGGKWEDYSLFLSMAIGPLSRVALQSADGAQERLQRDKSRHWREAVFHIKTMFTLDPCSMYRAQCRPLE